LTPEGIEPETLRRSTLPNPKPIPLGQPKWVFKIRNSHFSQFHFSAVCSSAAKMEIESVYLKGVAKNEIGSERGCQKRNWV